MRDNSPHILLTNYSMLEYLLIRPDDSPLFDNGCAQWWTFLVMDEAHQYRGSKAIEMGILLRRLKRRLREGGRTGPFQYIATSATIAGRSCNQFEPPPKSPPISRYCLFTNPIYIKNYPRKQPNCACWE